MSKNKYIYNNNQDFVKVFSVALLSYLDARNPGGKDMHIVDHATEAAGFAEAFFYTVDSIVDSAKE